MRLTGSDTTLAPVAAAIESMERKSLAREYVYRKKERYQVPLALALVAMTLALLLPPPPLRRPAAHSVARAAGVVLPLAVIISTPHRCVVCAVAVAAKR